MRRSFAAAGAAAGLAIAAAANAAGGEPTAGNPQDIVLQQGFDHIGAEVHTPDA